MTHFSADARQAMGKAGLAAHARKGSVLSPRDILIGILETRGAGGARLLKKLGADPRKLLADLRRSGQPSVPNAAAKRVVGWAIEEAARLGRKRLGTQHLLLGVLWAADRRLNALLRKHGIDAARVQKALR